MKSFSATWSTGTSGLAIFVALLAAPAVSAQVASPAATPPQATDAPQIGDEIVVTARKREENVLTVPIAVTSFSQRELEQRNIKGLRDVAALTPGLTFQDVNGAYAAPVIRGVAQIDQTSLQGNVGVFIDGVYLNNRTGLQFDMLEVGRVEIDKGPQSALYGRNTFEGAINYITIAPELGKWNGHAQVEVGNHDRQTYKGGLNVPLGDTAAIRLFGGWGKFDGTILNNRTGKYIGGYDGNYAYGGSFLWKPIDRLTVKLFGSYSRINASTVPLSQAPTINNNCGSTSIRSGVTYKTLYCGMLPKQTSVNVDDQVAYGTRGNNKLGYGTIDYDLDFATLSGTFSYAKGAYSNLVDTTADPRAITVPSFGGYSGQNFIESVTPNSTDKTLDIRLTSRAEQRLTYSLGFYGYDSDLTNITQITHQLLNQPTSDPVAFSTSGGRARYYGRAVYGALGFKVTPDLSVNAELRYTHERQKFNGTGSLAALANGTPIAGTQSFNFFTPRFTINYTVMPGVVLYANAARGVKTGGFNSNAFGPSPAYFRYGNESNWTYEAGFKTSLMNGALRLTGDFYYIDWSGIQGQRNVPGSTLSIVTNLGGAKVKGVEGSATYYFTRNLSLTATGSYTDPRYRNGFIDGDLAAPCGDFAGSTIASVGCSDLVGGNQIGRTSKWQYAVSGNYTVPDLFWNTDGYIRADYSYQSGKFTTGNDLQNQGAIKLLNASVGVIHKGVEFSLWVKNMLNFDYADRVTIAASTNDGGPTSGITYLRYYPGERRTFGFRADYRF